MLFELTNLERKYLGLELVKDTWEKVKIAEDMYLYFDKNIIRKAIEVKKGYYLERKMDYETIENRTILLPKTNRGKPTKITPSLIRNKEGYGTYFTFYDKTVMIGNYTTQKEYYSTYRKEKEIKDFKGLREWIENWIKESTPEDLKDIEAFSNAKREHVSYKEGDFFRFKIDRRNYGYGRILFDMYKFEKAGNPSWRILFGRPLLVSIYHIVTKDPNISIEHLKTLKSLPSQYIMHNVFFYGECKIIGNLPIEEHEKDYPIMYGKSISAIDPNKIMLQIGPLYKEIELTKNNLISDKYKNNAIGFLLDYTKEELLECIKTNSNEPYWNCKDWGREYDLRNQKNKSIKEKVFKQFHIETKK